MSYVANSRTLSESIRVRVTREQRDELEALAESEERPVGSLVRRAIRDLLERAREKTQ